MRALLRRMVGLLVLGWLLAGCAAPPASPTATPRPTSTPVLTSTPTPTQSPTPTLTPTPTFTPTPAPVCGHVRSLTVLVVGAYPNLYSMADAVRLVYLDFVDPAVRVVPLPRDLRVVLPQSAPYHSPVKLNSAYFLGTRNFVWDAPPESGALQLAATIEENFGIHVDRYLVVGAEGFARFIDAIGGVPVYFPYPLQDKNTHANFSAGQHWLNGRDALKLARIRMDSNDFVRIQRQSWLLKGVLKSLLQSETLEQLPQILESFKRMQLSNLTAEDLARATCLLGVMASQNHQPVFYAVPVDLLTQTKGEVYIWAIPKEKEAPPSKAFVLLWNDAYREWLQQALRGEVAP